MLIKKKKIEKVNLKGKKSLGRTEDLTHKKSIQGLPSSIIVRVGID